MEALDDLTYQKRRARLFNPVTAPYEELTQALFGPYVPPPPVYKFQPPPVYKFQTPPQHSPQPPPPQPVGPTPMVNPPPATPVKSGKTKVERQVSRSARRYMGAASSSATPPSGESDRSFRERVGLPPGLPSFNISPRAILEPFARRTKVDPS